MIRVLRILEQNGFDGVLIPDHSPEMTCAAPWHAGMAYALGWMREVDDPDATEITWTYLWTVNDVEVEIDIRHTR